MRNLLLTLFSVLLVALGHSQKFYWAQQLYGGGNDYTYSGDVDSLGNFYAVGRTKGGTSFSSSDGNDLHPTFYTDRDAYMVKYDPNGKALWSYVSGENVSCWFNDVDVINNKELVLTGFSSAIDDFIFNHASGSETYNIANVFIAKIDSSGSHLWSKNYGTLGSRSWGNSVVTDKDENVYVFGQFEGDLNIEGTLLSSNGGFDIFCIKYDADGNFLWVKSFGGLGDDDVNESIYNNNSVVFVGTYYLEDITFDAYSLQNLGHFDSYITAIDANGNVNISKSFSTQYGDFFNGISYTQGKYYACGSSRRDGIVVSFNEDDFSTNSTYNLSTVSSSSRSSVQSISSDNENFYITGSFEEGVVIDDSTIVANSSSDIFISCHNLSGDLIWYKQIDGNNYSSIKGKGTYVHISEDKSIFLAGDHVGVSEFEGFTLVETNVNSNAFYTKIIPFFDIDIITNYQSVCVGDTVPFTVNKTGEINDIILTSDGSIEVVNWNVDTVYIKFNTEGTFYLNAEFKNKWETKTKLFEEIITVSNDAGCEKLDLDEFKSNNIKVYPNPATLNTDIYISGLIGESDIIILNYLGKEVFNKKMASDGKIELKNISQGVYFVIIKFDDRQVVKKFILH
jgi:hypothetical protein